MTVDVERLVSKVMHGKDDWLFLTNDTSKVIDQITGAFRPFPQFDLAWKALFDFRAQMSRELKFKYAFLIAPNKECVYHDMLPDGIVISDKRLVFDVISQSSSELTEVIYPVDELVSARSTAETYSKGDTHWNGWGALVAFNLLAAKLGIRPITLIEIVLENRKIEGDLSSKIGKTTWDSIIKVIDPRFTEIYNNNIVGTGNKIIYETPDPFLPTAVFFRDSFSVFLIPLIAMSFRRVVLVWQPNIDYGIVREEKPDFVVSQQVERFLSRCPPDQTGKTNEELAHAKRLAAENL